MTGPTTHRRPVLRRQGGSGTVVLAAGVGTMFSLPVRLFLLSALILPGAQPFVAPVQAAEADNGPAPWQVSADKISRFVNPASIIAEGHVVLVRQGVSSLGQLATPGATAPSAGLKPLTISGDWIRIDPVANVVRVRGHAVLDSAEERVTAELVDLDMEKETGHLERATIYFPGRSLYLTGEAVEKTGDLTYHLEDGWVTRCAPADGQTPPWSFGWQRADITQEGFAHFRNVTFRVNEVPVVYSPYLAFPTNTKRKTGLLLPEWTGGERDGAGLLVPLFVSFSPSQDMTLYAGGLSQRGALAGAEFRYVQDLASKGTMALSYLDDRLTDRPGDDFKSDGVYRTISNRYWLRGKADHDFGDEVTGKLDIDLVSDQDYLEEYKDGLIGYGESAKQFSNVFGRGFAGKTTHARTNTAQLNKLWPAMSLGGEFRAFNDPTATRSTSHPWSLPSLAFAGSRALFPQRRQRAATDPFSASWLAKTDLAWDTGYVSYWQEDGVSAQRLDLHPALKAPLPLASFLETTAAVGLRQTMYLVDETGWPVYGSGNVNVNRTLTDFRLATSTILLRDFGLSALAYKRLTHMLRPGLSYTYLPAASQRDLPTLDSVDRIAPENLVTYELSNDFDVEGSDGRSWQFGYARLSQSYDIHERRRDLEAGERRRNFTDIVFESWLQPLPDMKLIYETEWDVYGDGATNYQLGASYATPRGDSLLLEHRYDAAQVVNQLNLALSVRLARTVRAQAVLFHSLDTDETSDASVRLLYEPACWGMALQASTTPDDAYRISLMFSLEGVGNIMGLSRTVSTSGGWSGL